MIERIAKTINIDNSRSHRNGLLPFVYYNGTNSSIVEVNEYTKNGNYGQFVCDFVVFEEVETDIPVDASQPDGEKKTVKKESKRLKYLDIINKYSFIQDQIRNGIFVKKYKFEVENVVNVNCENETTTTEKVTEIRWRTTFDELSSTATYNFQPLDKSYFRKDKDYYVYDEPSDFSELSGRYDELTDEEKTFVDKIEKHNNFANGEEEFAILIPNYDEVIKYNNWWKEWWGDNTDFFENYENSEIAELQFCVDVDKYLLGRVEVILTGDTKDNAPNYVFYTELKDRIAAEKEGEYFDFLKKITPIWQKNDAEKTWDKYTIKYIAPEVVLEAIINAEEESESLYIPYEYSINKETNEKEGVVSEYTVDEKYSGLTPTYVTFDEDTTIVVESQLQSLVHPKAQQVYRDIFGVYEEFDEGKGQMFECSIVTGVSSQNKEEYWTSGEVYTYIFNEDGEKTGEKKLIDIISPYITGEKSEKCATPNNSSSYISYTGCTNVTPNPIEEGEAQITVHNDGSGETIENTWTASTAYTYQWWECKPVDFGNRKCADGEIVAANNSGVYRNVTIASCINSLEGKAKIGEKYWVLARYKNGRHSVSTICDGGTIVPLKIPYLPDVPLNIATYSKTRTKEVEITISGITYDVIDNVTPNENGYIEIEYIKGKAGTIKKDENGNTEILGIDNTGIRYKDTIRYIPNNFDIIPIDGVYPAELYYDTLDLEESKKTIYSEEYNLKRKVLRSKIVSMEIGSQWTNDDAVNAMLFTKEGSDGLQEKPKEDINILYNRGNAAAWENHFKLSECNTMEDLENYGNNFFNL